MTAALVEVHVEQLLGYRVRDPDGIVVGRLEEFRVEVVDGDAVITEFHIGSEALLERITGFASELPLLRHLPFTFTEYRVPWNDMDLSNPRDPRVRVRRTALRKL